MKDQEVSLNEVTYTERGWLK